MPPSLNPSPLYCGSIKEGGSSSKTQRDTSISAPYRCVTGTRTNMPFVHTRVLLSTREADSLPLLSVSKVKASTQRLSVMVESSLLT